jgi:Caspase domain
MRVTKALIAAFALIGLAFLLTVRLSTPHAKAQPLHLQGRQLSQLDEPVQSWPTKAKRWALVIGVDQYADTQITTLGGASNDAKSLADALVRNGGFAQDQVFLLASDQPAERQPTRGNILRRLSNLAAVVPKDGLLLVSFAGHGMERGGQAFLLPSDAQVANDVDLLEQTAISVNRMKEAIRKTGVGQVVLVLDACRNDPVGRSDSDNPLTAAYTRGFNFDVRNREVTAFATLYATAVGQRAYEYKEKHQGYFTWELVQALKGGAANNKGEVTLAALVKYIQDRVPKHVLADLGAGKDQRPFAVIEGYRADELVIAISKPGTTSDSNPPTTSTGPTAVDPMAIELAYWETIKNSTDPEDFKSYLQKYPNGQFADLARRRAGATSGSTSSTGTDTSTTRNPATNTTTTPRLGSALANIYVLGVNVGMAEIACYQNVDAASIINYLNYARAAATTNGLPTDKIDYVMARLRAGAASNTQYQSMVEVRQAYESTLKRDCNCGRTMNFYNVLTLGGQFGFMEHVAWNNGDKKYLTDIVNLAKQYAAANGLATNSLDEMLGRLRRGNSRDVYQSLTSLSEQYIKELNVACGC